jgi:peptidoglycan hydrolase CwlO-like protein
VRNEGQPQRAKKAVALALIVAVLVLPAAVWGTPNQDPSKQREQVRAERAKLASQVDALRATDAEVERALDDLTANVNGQQALLAEAERASAEAIENLKSAKAAAKAKAAEIESLQESINELAVESLIHPPTEDVIKALESSSVAEAAKKEALLALTINRDSDLLDLLSAAKEDLEVQRDLAKDAADRAAEKEAEVGSRLSELEAARAQQSEFAAGVQARLDHALSESASLEALDKKLSADIARRQAELAAKAKASAPRAPRAPSSSSGGSRATFNGSLSSASCPTGGSITVASSIVDNLQSLLDAASADGIDMCGGGYRDSEQQVALRRAHCGSSDYDVYEKPSGDCSPPTAPPGTSMHEQGLAIDFTYGGRAIGSRSSPAYQWLASNASGYGLYNLPSEPWHWSTNGN